ncbi:neocarzinostatin apoprotein domain-containing protein [Catellatospora sichuanensis]|uniref:neocarzinostatin apoprotein domain-containing protein n=1 Tax=Catellatospora sichuanensis TaxID=1969805 RepID=UPI001182617E|nr:neocarzinostatin apoprotein domain-containing protein [Catellatospora sichuanensis]
MWRARAVAVLAVLAVSVPMFASPAVAKPVLTLSKSSGLSDGASITVNGSGFTANLKQIAIGQCIAEVKGPTDCNLAGGAQFVNADASGKIPSVTLRVAKKFGSFDCTKRSCVIAAQILPSSASDAIVKANATSTKISFGGSGGSSPAPQTTSPGTGTLAKTGPGDEHWVIVLAGTALLLPGIGFLLLMPRRRRAVTG